MSARARRVAAVYLTALVSSPVAGDESPNAAGERLLADAPPGWRRVYATTGAEIRLVEFVPESASEADWTDKISFESLARPSAPDADTFVGALADSQAAACDGFSHRQLFSGEENGYPTRVHLLMCSRNRLLEVGQVTMLKVIEGDAHLYTISRARRLADGGTSGAGLDEADVAEWSLYLRAISVCDSSSAAAHPCPPSEPPAESSAPTRTRPLAEP